MNKTTRILLVDDEPEILRTIVPFLEDAGYHVWTAATGRAALESTRENRPNLVLLDVLLPDLNGMEVCGHIKADPTLQDVFVILISGGATNTAHKVNGLGSGADDYLVKPFAPDELLARIQTIERLRNSMTALRASEEYYRRLVNILPDAVCLVQPDGRLLAVNSQAVTMLGYARPEELLQKNAFDLASPEEHERIKADIAMTLRTGMIRNAGYSVLRKDGVPFQMELSATVSPGTGGQPAGLLLVGRDVTERKDAEQKIRQLLALLDRASDAIIIHDPEGCVQYFNQGAERLFGWTADEVRGQRINDLFFRDKSAFAAVQQQLLQTGEWSGEIQAITKARKPIIVHSRWTLVQNAGQPSHVVSISTDITEHKKGEQALQDAEARYRSIFENATEGIFRTTPDGRILTANPALARMFGYQSPEEMMASVTDIGRQIYVSFEKRLEMINLLQKQGAIQGFEEENYHKDGSIIWVSLNAHVIRDATGTIECFEGTIRDITNRKWAERWLRTQRDFATFLSSSIDLNATAVQLLEIILKNEGIDCGGVFLLKSETGALDLVAHRGFSADFAERTSHFPAADPAPIRSSPPVRIGSRRFGGPLARIVRELKRQRLRAMEIVPIQHGGEVVAVLVVGSRVWKEIPARSCQAVELLGTQAAGAIARVKAEQSLRASQRLLERTLESLFSAVFVTNADTMIIEECNPTTTQMFGYTRNELIGQSAATLHVSKAAAKEFAGHLQAAIASQGYLGSFEFKMRRKNGTIFPTEQSITSIRNELGHLVSYVNVVQDITERKRSEAELRQLPRLIIEAQETERLRVAREMHDGVNQVIASVKMRLGKVESQLETMSPATREILARCDHLLVRALEDNRRIAHNLRPSDLDELGLAAACRNYCKEVEARTSLTVVCHIAPSNRRLPSVVELNLFRIVQEALTNVEKHARAKIVRLQLSFQAGTVSLTIQDDGRGFAPRRFKVGREKWHGIGLTNIRERALSLDGTCEIQSAPKKGTTINVRIPGKAAA